MTPGNARSTSLIGLALGGGAGVITAARPWWRAAGDGVAVAFTGTQSSVGLAQALPVVVLAGVVLALVLTFRGRRVLGGVLVLAGVGMVVLGVSHPRPGAQTVLDSVREVTLADSFALGATGWPWAYAAAGVVVAAAALTSTLTAASWPRRSSRFERPDAVPTLDEDDPAALWRAQDAGADPTQAGADHEPQPSPTPRPNVRDGGVGARMEDSEQSGRTSSQSE